MSSESVGTVNQVNDRLRSCSRYSASQTLTSAVGRSRLWLHSEIFIHYRPASGTQQK